jgi:putative endonuclease
MKYVYILQSISEPERYYVGITDDLKKRVHSHNAGQVAHTSKYKPWRVNTYIAFSNESRAFEF